MSIGTPRGQGFKMPAEFEPHDGTIMIFPERPGSWVYGALPARKIFVQMISELAKHERVFLAVSGDSRPEAERMLAGVQNIALLDIPTDDAWARDTAPTFVRNESGEVRGIDWQFNAWGGTFDGLYAHWERDNAFAGEVCKRLGYERFDKQDFVLEGGSIHSDGAGLIMTTESCLLSRGRNPHMSKAEIERTLLEYLGGERVIWLPRGIWGDETNEHVDNVCAFIRPNEVVLAWTDDKSDPQYELSAACLATLESEGVTVHKLPIPWVPVRITQRDLDGFTFEEGEDVREFGERLAASYVNFYFANDIILLPQFGGMNESSDRQAVQIIGQLCPDREIVPIPARELIIGGGNIHCLTQQIPKGAMKWVK